MVIRRKTLLWVSAITVALFVIAAPLGDSKHGLGRHHKWLAQLGDALFLAFEIGAGVLVALSVVALVQRTRSRRARA